jgi:exodeoxyribonuclease V alpha subunit
MFASDRGFPLTMDTLAGSVDRLLHVSEETGWAVLTLDTEAGGATVVGALAHLRPGESVHLRGAYVTNPKYGKQFKADAVEVVAPATNRGIERFLQSVPGVGPATARAIVEHFGAATLEVAERTPSRLTEVFLVNAARAEAIAAEVRGRIAEVRVVAKLRAWAVPERFTARILKSYGTSACELIEENPYRLIDDFEGIGFVTADTIARASGVPHTSPFRVRAGVMHILAKATGDGHCYLPVVNLVRDAARLLGLKGDAVREELSDLESGGRLVLDDEAAYLRRLFDVECEVAERLRALVEQSVTCDECRGCGLVESMESGEVECGSCCGSGVTHHEPRCSACGEPQFDTPSGVTCSNGHGDAAAEDEDSRDAAQRRIAVPADDAELSRIAGVALTSRQAEAIRAACSEPLVVITGGPGVGKTLVTKTIVALVRISSATVRLCAPTGRAAKRLSEVTGAQATTIHRLLEYHPALGWRRNRICPIDGDLVICDETSMVDVQLIARLLDALPHGCRLVLVGDADQLPSVGPGRVLRDVVESGVCRVVTLDRVFRQGAASRISINAHRVNRGQALELPERGEESDFYTAFVSDADSLQREIVRMATEAIPARLGVNFVRDVLVLAPMYKGAVGVDALNEALQATVNPGGAKFGSDKRGLRVGDRVIETRNQYDLDVYNGDLGVVRAVGIGDEGKGIEVEIDGRTVEYNPEQARTLRLGYALTVHKAQGGEMPVVLLVCHKSHTIMLQRTLLYTGMTRARRLLVLCGTRDAVAIATSRTESRQRWTGLVKRLRETE